jgi:hypothetical protein
MQLVGMAALKFWLALTQHWDSVGAAAAARPRPVSGFGCFILPHSMAAILRRWARALSSPLFDRREELHRHTRTQQHRSIVMPGA